MIGGTGNEVLVTLATMIITAFGLFFRKRLLSTEAKVVSENLASASIYNNLVADNERYRSIIEHQTTRITELETKLQKYLIIEPKYYALKSNHGRLKEILCTDCKQKVDL